MASAAPSASPDVARAPSTATRSPSPAAAGEEFPRLGLRVACQVRVCERTCSANSAEVDESSTEPRDSSPAVAGEGDRVAVEGAPRDSIGVAAPVTASIRAALLAQAEGSRSPRALATKLKRGRLGWLSVRARRRGSFRPVQSRSPLGRAAVGGASAGGNLRWRRGHARQAAPDALVFSFVTLLATAGPAGAAANRLWNDCRSSDPAVSISACTDLIETSVGSSDEPATAYSHRGDAYAAKGDYARAIDDYNDAIRLSPRHRALCL